jgi:hypothetical protein
MNGTTTPICDLIEKLMSQELSHGTLGQVLAIARPIEEAITRKTPRLPSQKRENDRIRKANYRAGIRIRVPKSVPGTIGTESLILIKKESVDSVKEKERETCYVPRDKLGQNDDWPRDYREQFWRAYPRKTEKKSALSKLDAIRKSGRVLWSVFIAGVKRYAAHIVGTEERYIKHPTTWLNRGCWDDEHGENNARHSQAGTASSTRSETARLDPIIAGVGNIADRITQRKLAEGPRDGQVGFGFDSAVQSYAR